MTNDESEDDITADDALTPPTFTHSGYNLFGPQHGTLQTFGEPYERVPESPQRRRLRWIFGGLVFVVFIVPLLLWAARVFWTLIT